MQSLPQPNPPAPSSPPEETGNKKVVLNVLQFLGILGATLTFGYYVSDNLSQRADKLHDEIEKTADNLTALDTSIRQIETLELVTTQRVNENFSKVQSRLEVIEKTTKVFVPPTSNISVIEVEATPRMPKP